MAESGAGRERTLRFARRIAATRERIFRAWTDVAALRTWFGPEGYETSLMELDLRAGGAYRLVLSRASDRRTLGVRGTFVEFRRPERLAYTCVWESEPEMGTTVVTLELAARGGGTELRLTHSGFPDDRALLEHRESWNECLDRLEKYVKDGRSSDRPEEGR